jgi:uncharacterized protein YcnI
VGVRRHFRLALVGATGFTALAVVAFATPAWAHVTVDPSSAPRGGEITLGFRVPNEEATAATVKVQIFFPSNPPVLGIDPEEAPGWTNQVHTAPLNPPITTDDGPLTSYVNEVDWSGGSIPPGHFQEFYVLAQQLPTSGNQVVFKALQTYSDGNVVRWIQTTAPGAPEPAHPAPVLTLIAPGAPGAASSSGGSDTLGVVGVILAALALVLGGVALALVVRRRGSTGQPSVEPTAGSRPLDANTPSEAER